VNGGESVLISGARSSSATMVASRPIGKRCQWSGAAISVGRSMPSIGGDRATSKKAAKRDRCRQAGKEADRANARECRVGLTERSAPGRFGGLSPQLAPRSREGGPSQGGIDQNRPDRVGEVPDAYQPDVHQNHAVPPGAREDLFVRTRNTTRATAMRGGATLDHSLQNPSGEVAACICPMVVATTAAITKHSRGSRSMQATVTAPITPVQGSRYWGVPIRGPR
jgi:hypothetical protein